ncbi:hypothetical protein SDC9_139353 [bioreactor metagenome]|uniref:Uncharacterized protein n=1 Tax=bioreactor metagenome TaxID=1076179 RepID=A0A645DSV9_9ZZZZ
MDRQARAYRRGHAKDIVWFRTVHNQQGIRVERRQIDRFPCFRDQRVEMRARELHHVPVLGDHTSVFEQMQAEAIFPVRRALFDHSGVHHRSQQVMHGALRPAGRAA